MKNFITLERSEKRTQRYEELPVDCNTSVIQSQGLYGKEDKLSHKELRPIDSDIVNNYDTEFQL